MGTALPRYKPGNNKSLAEDLGHFISNVNIWFNIFNNYMKHGAVPTKSVYGINLELQQDHLKKCLT